MSKTASRKKRTVNKSKLDDSFGTIEAVLRAASDSDIPMLLGDGVLTRFLESIATPKKPGKLTPYEYLAANKRRLQILALIRAAISRNYPVKGYVAGKAAVYVSPTEMQWFDDGVMLVQGTEPFTGHLALYQHGQLKFALAARDTQPGEELSKEDFNFVPVDEIHLRAHQPSVPRTVEELHATLAELEAMLEQGVADEKKYQSFLMAHPWVFGAQFTRIDSHVAFDDANIPDFSAVRVRDGSRDVIEIKSPELVLFGKKGNPRKPLSDAWMQAIRYLDFAKQEGDYLRRQKGLLFDNPQCHLIIGKTMTASQRSVLRMMERGIPGITVYSYADVLAMAKSTVKFVERLRSPEGEGRVVST